MSARSRRIEGALLLNISNFTQGLNTTKIQLATIIKQKKNEKTFNSLKIL